MAVKVLEILLFNSDLRRQSCRLHIILGHVHRHEIYIIAIHMMFKLTLTAIIIIYLIKKVCIKVRPFFKGILLAEHSRSYVFGYQRCLNDNGTTATHRVNKVCFTPPAGHHDHAGGKNLVQRSLHRFLAVTTPMQRLATGIQ